MEQDTLGQWLKERCRKEGLSLRQAAAKTGLSHATISGLINGSNPLPETFRKLAWGLGGDGSLALEAHLLELAGYRTPRPGEEPAYLRMIPLLLPEHQYIVKVVVTELAKVEEARKEV